jgi:hypothetical protein
VKEEGWVDVKKGGDCGVLGGVWEGKYFTAWALDRRGNRKAVIVRKWRTDRIHTRTILVQTKSTYRDGCCPPISMLVAASYRKDV